MDLPAGPGGPQGRGRPVPVPEATGPEAELEGRAACRSGPHSGAGGHCRASCGGGGEEPGRGLGAGHDRRRDAPGGALLSSVDRGSWFTILELLAGKAAAPVTEALLRRLGPFRDRTHTLTADNGKEFAGHEEVAAGLDAGFYFAIPYHSWERGLNEHVNGLVRQYFPKGADFRQVAAEQVREVEDRLNHRPRKVLGYRTPYEVFHGGLAPPGPCRPDGPAPRPPRAGDAPVRPASGLAMPPGTVYNAGKSGLSPLRGRTNTPLP